MRAPTYRTGNINTNTEYTCVGAAIGRPFVCFAATPFLLPQSSVTVCSYLSLLCCGFLFNIFVIYSNIYEIFMKYFCPSCFSEKF